MKRLPGRSAQSWSLTGLSSSARPWPERTAMRNIARSWVTDSAGPIP